MTSPLSEIYSSNSMGQNKPQQIRTFITFAATKMLSRLEITKNAKSKKEESKAEERSFFSSKKVATWAQLQMSPWTKKRSSQIRVFHCPRFFTGQWFVSNWRQIKQSSQGDEMTNLRFVKLNINSWLSYLYKFGNKNS